MVPCLDWNYERGYKVVDLLQATPRRKRNLEINQRPSTAGASFEKHSNAAHCTEDKNPERHSSCELREICDEDIDFTTPSLNSVSFPEPTQKRPNVHIPEPLLQLPSKTTYGHETGILDMTASTSKIDELNFFPAEGQQVLMRANMVYEACPISTKLNEQHNASMNPVYIPHLSKPGTSKDNSLFMNRRSTGSLLDKKKGDKIVSIWKSRSHNAVKGRRRKERSPFANGLSCSNEAIEDESSMWQMMHTSEELSSSSLPVYPDECESVASTEAEDVPSRRRWPKIPQNFTSSTVKYVERSLHITDKSLETDSTTTEIETDTTVVVENMARSSLGRPKSRVGKIRRSRLKEINPLVASIQNWGSTCNPEAEEESDSTSSKIFKNKKRDTEILGTRWGASLGDAKSHVCHINETQVGEVVTRDEVEVSSAQEEVRKTQASSSKAVKSTTVIILPTCSSYHGEDPNQQHRIQPSDLNPPQPATEERTHSPCALGEDPSGSHGQQQPCTDRLEPLRENSDGAHLNLPGGEVYSSPRKKHGHNLTPENSLPHKQLSYYLEDSSVSSESADEKHVDTSSMNAQEITEAEAHDVFVVTCETTFSQRDFQSAHPSDGDGDQALSSVKQGTADDKYVHASLSTEKLCSILSYLGQVEESNLQENRHLGEKIGTPRGICYSPTENCSPRTVLEHADDTISLTSSSQTAHSSPLSAEGDQKVTDRSPTLAACVFDGVRKKVQELKDKICAHEAHIMKLKAEKEKLVQEREQDLHV